VVLEQPALEVGPPSSWDSLDGAIATLDQFDWLVLTSANGVESFLERLLAQGRDGRSLNHLQIAVVGRKTASTLQQRGLRADFIPPDFVADSLVEHFPGGDHLTGVRILFPRVETGGRDVLVAQLTAKGATVVEVNAYESRCPLAMEADVLTALQQQRVDMITFASSKTVQHFCQLLAQAAAQAGSSEVADWQSWLQFTRLVSIGPQTSQACCQYLGRVDLEAREYTLEGLVACILASEPTAVPSAHSPQ
jgi:uroporphyrinogen-III synthase